MHYYLIKVEEKELELKFGQDYLDYKKRVARYLPALKRREQAVKS
jgi:protein-S-isoprenylcysteine O-methyltransferase Ste14